jgi:hypothetical protein
MKNCLASLFLVVSSLVACHSSPLFAQAGGISQPVVANKYSYAAVQKTATGNIWTTAQSSLNYQDAILYWVTAGSPGSCTLLPLTGPTAALATLAIDDPNYSITCTSSGQKAISGLNNYFNVDVSALTTGGGQSVTVYVTLSNFNSNSLAQTLSSIAQGNGAASPGALPWYAQQSDGTNLGPVADASARSKYVRVNDGSSHYMPAADASARSVYVIGNDGSSHYRPAGDASARSVYVTNNDGTYSQPAGDAQARGINITPGTGTNAFKDVLAGVGALGAGVQQVAQLGTLSSPVAANTLTQVVADPGSGAATVLLGVYVEKATVTTGQVTVRYGTDSNCGTGTTTLMTIGPSTGTSPVRVGYYPLGALVPAHKALCLITNASSTSARVLTQ